MTTFTDRDRERLKERRKTIDDMVDRQYAAIEELHKVIQALKTQHAVAIEEAGAELLAAKCRECGRLLIAGDLGHCCTDGSLLCERCAPTWARLLDQLNNDPGFEPRPARYRADTVLVAEHYGPCTPLGGREFNLTLGRIQARIAAGNGDKKHVWPL